MLVLSTGWIASILAQAQATDPLAPLPHVTAYADNWGWLVHNPRQHSPILTITQSYVAAFRITIDWQKSWIWMNTQVHLAMLKSIVRDQIGELHLQQCLTVNDLG